MTTIQISQANLENNQLDVVWQDQTFSRFDAIWLRDNCCCVDCGDPAIGRRKLRLTDLDLDCTPSSIEYSGDSISLVWPDEHRSQFDAAWLHRHAYDENNRKQRQFQPTLWDDAFRQQPPSFDYADIDGNDRGLLDLLHELRDSGLCFIHNAPAKAGIVEALANRFGYPQRSNFGLVQDLIANRGQLSIANDMDALKLHTDEPYRASPPGILLFHCIDTDTNGTGWSTFMDGFDIAERLRQHDPAGFDALRFNAQAFRRHFKDNVDLISEFPIISTDEFGQLSGIRLNDRVAAPLSISPDQISDYYRGLKYLLELSESEALTLKLKLQPGDIAVFDNHRVLHGRTTLTLNGRRWLQWVQIERGDFHSSLRIIADRLGLERDDNPLLRGAYGANGKQQEMQ